MAGNSNDSVTVVSKKSYGSKLKSAIGGIGVGLLLFFGSFYLLFWNEGRVDMSKVVANAVEINASTVLPEHEGKFVAARGVLSSTGEIGDAFIAPDNYIAVDRKVEMYAWKENSSSTTEKKVGGSEETTTTYTYAKEWTTSPENSSNFKKQEGHYNPAMIYDNDSVVASTAMVGAYTVTPPKLARSGYAGLPVTPEILNEGIITATGATMSGTTMSGSTMEPTLTNGLLYIGSGTMSTPEIGDVKISYKALRPGAEFTVLGKVEGNNIIPYVEQGKGTVYELSQSSLSEIVSQKAVEHSTMGWVWRVVGFIMMWTGLTSILAPISVLLDILPILGDISHGLISFVTFIIAMILSIMTIIVSMILHNIWAVIIVALLILGAAYVIISKKLQKKAA